VFLGEQELARSMSAHIVAALEKPH
jgi:hypothetical protein